MTRCTENPHKIRLTLIDSTGVPVGPFDAKKSHYLTDLLKITHMTSLQYKNLAFEVGLLNVASQYDRKHCKDWLAEFMRKTPNFSSLSHDLWEKSSEIEESQLIKLCGSTEAYGIPLLDKLSASLLNQLPPKYMMAVQKPSIIREYIHNYDENPADIKKLKDLLKKETLPDYKLPNGRLVETNVHLERKSLKYLLEIIVGKLELPEQDLKEFTLFLKKNSPYYDLSDNE